jgi:hypothetical protein
MSLSFRFTPCVVDAGLGKEWGKSANTRGSRVVPWAVSVPYRNILAVRPPNSLLVYVSVPAAPP